jgi:thioesterase domain-containing protein/aryl carrier-like protein
VPGELVAGGPQVARGYLGRPGLTAERFVPDPYGPPGARMYRSLDRGRWRADGTLDYLGRADAQVKVRGYRIELEEVEQAVASHPAVAEAGATVQGSAQDRRLAVFMVPAAGAAAPSTAELRAWVRERLPEYMVPGAWAWVDALPRTGSGKLDRRALPQDADAAVDAVPYVAPRTPLEQRLAEIWADVLGVDAVGVHDDFFELGGQSILATRLVARVREELGGEVTVASLLTAPTLEDMAKAVEGRAAAVRLPLVALQTFGERPPLFLAHPAGGHVVCYRELGALLAPDQPVYALQPRGALDGQAPIASIREMAALYVAAIREFRPRGPYRVGGWSFGGVVAWEMAQQLVAAGCEVDLLAMFDTSPLGVAVEIDPRDPADVVWNTVAGLAGHAAAAKVSVDELRGMDTRDAVLKMIRLMATPTLPEERADDALALTALRAANLQAQAEYEPRPYPGHLTYFRTLGSETTPALAPGLEFWSRLALGGTTVHRVPGSHGTMLLEPHVHALVEAVLAVDGG